jgi:hypothetical protein
MYRPLLDRGKVAGKMPALRGLPQGLPRAYLLASIRPRV